MSLALLCSGQGRQHRTMFDLLANSEAAGPVLSKASQMLGEDIHRFLTDAPDGTLFANRTSQILCVTSALATYAALFPEGAPPDSIVAGYSVGEMAAWGVAGIWSSEQTLDLVEVRARCMDASSGPHDGLCYVRGLRRKDVNRLAAEFGCEIAIVNPGNLFVIGGERPVLEQLCKAASDQAGGYAGLLSVHVASHTCRLADAVEPIAQAFQAAPTQRPRIRVLATGNHTLILDPAAGVPGLAQQVANPIDWETTLSILAERGASRVLELGPGSGLADLARIAMPDIAVRSADDFHTLAGLRAWLGD